MGQALEALAAVASARPVRSLRQSEVDAALRAGRTCYDHLAGVLGVALTKALVDAERLVPTETGFALSLAGERFLSDFGVDVAGARHAHRAFAGRCLDWSERRHHLAGALGAAVFQRVLDLGWIERAASSRAVRVTPAGRAGFRDVFGME